MSAGRAFRAFLAKDLLREARTGEMLFGVAAFGLAVILVLSFALPRGAALDARSAAGAFWIAVLLAVQVGLARAIEVEREAGRLETLRSTSVNRAELFLAKAVSIFVFILLAAALLALPWTMLFNLNFRSTLSAAPAAFLGLVGLALAGTLIALLASGTRMREILMPVLYLTLFVPLLLAAVNATESAMTGQPGQGLHVLVAFDLIVGGASILLAPLLLEE